ncbi:MAG: DUF4007 family protein [Treponema sp.]|nr:DUF4007 family protein [Treponema sp.]
MKFKGHQTFYIRRGWLGKGLKQIDKYPLFFTAKNIDQTTELGVGSNMVNSIRYYLPCVGLTNEIKLKGQEKTFFAELVLKHDKYMQQYGTLLWLHYNLATNKDAATSWYYFFNEYKSMEIDRESFISGLKDYINQNDPKQMPADKSIEDDFVCIINTYLQRNNEKDTFEDNLECPLAELELLTQKQTTTGKIIRKTSCDVEKFPLYIALAVIINCRKENQSEIKIDFIENAVCNLGKVFNLGIVDVSRILERLQNEKLIKVIRTAGIENIQLSDNIKNYSVNDCLAKYYEEEI